MYKIIFVCTGNTCRSPMAMYLTKHIAQQKNVKGIQIESRGMFVTETKLAEHARAVLKTFGMHNLRFSAKQLTLQDVVQADCLITMTRAQATNLALQYPVHACKILSVANFLNNQKDVIDPYGQSKEVYMQTAKYLEFVAEEIVETYKEEGKICLEN